MLCSCFGYATLPGLPREKLLAAVVRLLDGTLARVGNGEYRRENHSFGLTTLRDRHLQVAGSRVALSFRGKGGKQLEPLSRNPEQSQRSPR
jgi:DNA topoisomerase I